MRQKDISMGVCVLFCLCVCVMGEREIKEVMCWPAVQRTDSNITQSKSKTLHQHKSQRSRRRQEKNQKKNTIFVVYNRNVVNQSAQSDLCCFFIFKPSNGPFAASDSCHDSRQAKHFTSEYDRKQRQ